MFEFIKLFLLLLACEDSINDEWPLTLVIGEPFFSPEHWWCWR